MKQESENRTVQAKLTQYEGTLGGGKPAVAVCNTDEAEPESNNRKTEITPGEHHSFYLLG